MNASRTSTRVLLLVQNLPVPFDRRVWMEATALSRAGYHVTVICPNSERYPKLVESLDGVEIRRFPLWIEGRTSIGMLLEYATSLTMMFGMVLWQSLRRPIHVTHICNPPDLLFACALPARIIRRSKLIFDQHDLGPELWEAKGNSPIGLLGRIIRWAERRTYHAADGVISTNESYREIAITRGHKSPNDVFVVRSAPKRTFGAPRPVAQDRDDNVGRLVYLGTMGSQEGIDILLDAMGNLAAGNTGVRFTLDLIGDGPERVRLEQQAQALGLASDCTFHGRVSDARLGELLGAADIAVNPDRPSTMNDLSSMNKIVEYMAFGLPIVQFASREGQRTALEGSRYVDDPNADALAEAILRLWNDHAGRAHMSEFSRRRFLTDLCWEQQEPNLLVAYRHVLGVDPVTSKDC